MTQATAQKFDTEERRQYLGASEIAAVMGLDLDLIGGKLALRVLDSEVVFA